MRAAVCAALLLLLPSAVWAQDDQNTSSQSEASTRVSVAPQAVREIVAEGRAAIGPSGVLGARRAAQAAALRAAVEKAIGVFVSARTLTQNYTLVRDQVTTRAEGFATLKEVVSERVGTQDVSVTVRALVSLRPLAEQLKAVGLTRAWRVHVQGGGSGTPIAADERAILERTLAEAGFAVVSSDRDADLLIRVSPRTVPVAARNVQAGDVPMTMYSVRGEVSVRATRAGTGEVVAALSSADTALHINRETAGTVALSGATEVIAPRLADALMVLPAAQSQPVILVVSNLSRAAQVGKLEDALNTLTGVRAVTRRSWTSGVATWELDVLGDAASTLTRELEEAGSVKRFGLSVSSETRSKIVASARGR